MFTVQEIFGISLFRRHRERIIFHSSVFLWIMALQTLELKRTKNIWIWIYSLFIKLSDWILRGEELRVLPTREGLGQPASQKGPSEQKGEAGAHRNVAGNSEESVHPRIGAPGEGETASEQNTPSRCEPTRGTPIQQGGSARVDQGVQLSRRKMWEAREIQGRDIHTDLQSLRRCQDRTRHRITRGGMVRITTVWIQQIESFSSFISLFFQ